MKSLFDEIEQFKTLLDDKEPVSYPEGFEPSLEHELEAWSLGDYIPNTYLENGVRKIYVWDEDVEQRYELVRGKMKQIKEIF